MTALHVCLRLGNGLNYFFFLEKGIFFKPPPPHDLKSSKKINLGVIPQILSLVGGPTQGSRTAAILSLVFPVVLGWRKFIWRRPWWPPSHPRRFWSRPWIFWSRPRRFWSCVRRFWSRPWIFWSRPRRFWSRPRRLWSRPLIGHGH